jgi:hypothetical protein
MDSGSILLETPSHPGRESVGPIMLPQRRSVPSWSGTSVFDPVPSHFLREQHRLRVFENGAERKTWTEKRISDRKLERSFITCTLLQVKLESSSQGV